MPGLGWVAICWRERKEMKGRRKEERNGTKEEIIKMRKGGMGMEGRR